MGVRAALWRPLGTFRWVSLAYAVVLAARAQDGYARPAAGWTFLGLMVVWTALMTVAAPRADAAGRTRELRAYVVGDVLVCVAAVLATRLVDTAAHIDAGARTLPAVWAAGGVMTAALVGGALGGTAAAALVSAATVAERSQVSDATVGSVVLLLLTGVVIGYLVETAVDAEASLTRERARGAAAAERDRLAREVHDGALQTLALLAREAGRLPAEQVAALAAAQETSLRRLVSVAPATPGSAVPDLVQLLEVFERQGVVVGTPGAPVPLAAAAEVAAAVRALLDNVTRHAGPDAVAWVLVEDDGTEIVVTVRDDGVGMAPGREEAASRSGRLGLARSVRGRIAAVGGRVTVTSAPGRGTEVELRVPR